eukprot:GFYU01020517.1.p1 GENE.GFYU01020517.1~~GFYU01020517.1.p1  ORF type:complete len:155 (+),score=26.57 GFYU01020517.1:182-646(+)
MAGSSVSCVAMTALLLALMDCCHAYTSCNSTLYCTDHGNCLATDPGNVNATFTCNCFTGWDGKRCNEPYDGSPSTANTIIGVIAYVFLGAVVIACACACRNPKYRTAEGWIECVKDQCSELANTDGSGVTDAEKAENERRDHNRADRARIGLPT